MLATENEPLTLSYLPPSLTHEKSLTQAIQRIHTLLPVNFPFFLQHQLLHNKRRRGWISKPFFGCTCSLGVGNIFELEDNLFEQRRFKRIVVRNCTQQHSSTLKSDSKQTLLRNS